MLDQIRPHGLTGAARIAVETEEGQISTVSLALFKLKLLPLAYELLVVHDPGRVTSIENPEDWWRYYEQGARWSCTVGRI
jgi:hypothetical protein